MTERDKIIKICNEVADKYNTSGKIFIAGSNFKDLADSILEAGHKCPWNIACTCYLHYECKGCETYAEALEEKKSRKGSGKKSWITRRKHFS